MDAAREAPHEDALVADGVTYSWGAIGRRVAAACVALGTLGVTPGDRIALRASNRVETVVALLACMELGIAFVPIHPRLTDDEAAVLVTDARVARVLDDAAVAALAQGACDLPAHHGTMTAAVERGGNGVLDAASVLAMLYTSGTTGRPKGALLTRGAFVASARASARNLGWLPGDRWLACMPLCHVGGLSILTRCLLARRCVVLTERFDPRAVLATVARERVTLASVVPTMLRALLAEDRDGVMALPRAVLVGGPRRPCR